MKEQSILDIDAAYMALTMDIITEYCYGKSSDFLLEPDFRYQWRDCMVETFDKAAFRRAVPWLTPLLQKLPSEYLLKLFPSMRFLITWQQDIKKQVQEIVSQDKKGHGEGRNIFRDLKDNERLPKAEKTVERLADEGEILVGAGSETTAKTLTYTTFYILNTPGVLEKLRKELKGEMKHSTDVPTWTQLEQLPYLVR